MRSVGGESFSAALRFRWLDRWLEPRWRALLTWVVLAALITAAQTTHTAIRLQDDIRMWLHNQLLDVFRAYTPLDGPNLFTAFSFRLTDALAWSWFPPIVLRLGVVRNLVWILAGVAGYFVFAMTLVPAPPVPWSTMAFALYVLAAGLPGLALIRRRTKPWMTLVAGFAFALVIFGCMRLGPHKWQVYFMFGNVLYGAVMLYGTDPLPRGPAERQRGEDQR